MLDMQNMGYSEWYSIKFSKKDTALAPFDVISLIKTATLSYYRALISHLLGAYSYDYEEK